MINTVQLSRFAQRARGHKGYNLLEESRNETFENVLGNNWPTLLSSASIICVNTRSTSRNQCEEAHTHALNNTTES